MGIYKPWEDYKDKVLDKIKALETELAGLKAELNEPNKIKFEYKFKECYHVAHSWISAKMEGNDKASLENFRYRQAKDNAQADFQLQKELMCIGALAEQIDPDYKSKIDIETSAPCCYIYYGKESKKYHYSSDTFTRTLGVVYMPQSVAEKICEILNKKQVEL